jgi:radical SAM superfamily enzyme YgiQ (UPF0313 family)
MSSSCEVVFVFPPAHGNVGAFKNHLGVAYLRATLHRAGITSTQYLNEHPGSIASVTDDLLSYLPRVVGFTVYDANFPLALALAQAIKSRRSDVRVIFGGPTATFGAEYILSRHAAVDYCIRGETEDIGPGLLQMLINGHSLDSDLLTGVAFRRENAIVCPSLPPLVGCDAVASCGLDNTPSPYLTGVLTDGRPGVLTGRGCTYNCQYCCFAALGRKRLRLHSIDRVLEELEFIAAQQKRTNEHYPVSIHDDAFTLVPDRAKKLCQMIADRNLGIVLSCITRADKVDDELFRLMRDAGFVSLAFGLESSVPSVLRATGKVRPPDWHDPDLGPERDFVEQVRKSVRSAKDHGLNVGVSIILGLPTETADDGAATLRFVRELPIDFYMHNYLWVFPGTPLWDTHPQYGLKTAIDSLGLPSTVEYAYDITRLPPGPKCSLEHEAEFLRLLTADVLFGCEAFPASDGHAATAVVNAGELSKATAAWLADILSIGSLVIQVYPSLKTSGQADRLHQDRIRFSECLVPARNYVQLLRRQNRRFADRWLLACAGIDLYCSHKPELVSIESAGDARPLIDWANGNSRFSDICELSELLRSPGVPDPVLVSISTENPGSRLRKMPAPPVLKYPGRWMRGKAPCSSLSRMEIDGEGLVRSCRHGEPIGKAGDSLEQLRAAIAAATREAELRRGCDACTSPHCPRCPYPGMDDQAYCRLMTEQKRVLEFLNVVRPYSRFPLILENKHDTLGND